MFTILSFKDKVFFFTPFYCIMLENRRDIVDFNVMDTSVDNNIVSTPTDVSDNQPVDPAYTYDNNEYAQVDTDMNTNTNVLSNDGVTTEENELEESTDDLDQEMALIADYYDQLKNITIENLKLEKQLKEIEEKIKLNNDTKKQIKEKYADRF